MAVKNGGEVSRLHLALADPTGEGPLWHQPWTPLFLEWRARYHHIDVSPSADADTGGHWSFDGTRYTRSGTDPSGGEGVGPDGGHYYPAFPYPAYTKITDQDVSDLWAYLRSLEPDERPDRPHELSFPFNIRWLNWGWKLLFFREGPVHHMVDFMDYEADAGDVLWIRPGQVHGFSATDRYVGTALTMQPGFLPRATVEATGLYRYDRPPLLHPDAPSDAGSEA